MGIKERKKRDKENLRKLIIAHAHEILRKEGLEALTMRALARHIEYSQSKIYEFFTSKDALCTTLCQDYCEKLLVILKKIAKEENPEKCLIDLVTTTVEFHGLHPHSDTLLTYICFGQQTAKIPAAFLEIETLFIEALKNLGNSYFTTKEEIFTALNMIRCIFIGVSTLTNLNTSLDNQAKSLKIARSLITTLLKGWKK